ncbi:unnamed protein product [Cylicostephanus goldi]|uniref:Uncharacterized protein n=1 Tax=Cylicostephanus goldi TaxID=71465 RepID=A0A3P7NKC5_CYLGO|nr:unnamed protein product [Cylicostephanus goldi]
MVLARRAEHEAIHDVSLSLYSTLSPNHLPLQEGVASQGATMTMGNPPPGVISPLERAMSIDEHLQSMPMPTDWNDQYRSQEVGAYISLIGNCQVWLLSARSVLKAVMRLLITRSTCYEN